MYLRTEMKYHEKELHPYKKATALQKLYAFQKEPIQNKKCANCGDFGPMYICINFGTFVCTTCAGIHRELHHRVKSIALSEWTNEEIQFILSHGNLKDQSLYLASLSESEQIYQHHTYASLRLWIIDKYIHKKWYLHNNSNNKTLQDSKIPPTNSVPLIQLDNTATSTDSQGAKGLLDCLHGFSATQHKFKEKPKENCQPETPTVSFFNFPDLTYDIKKDTVSLSFGDKKNNTFNGHIKQEVIHDHQKTSLEWNSKSDRQQKDTNLSNWAMQLHNETKENNLINLSPSVHNTSLLVDEKNISLPTDVASLSSSTKAIKSTMPSQDTRYGRNSEYATTDSSFKNPLNIIKVSPCCDYLFDTLP